MALTRGGVAYDLNESPYRLDVPYDQEVLTLVFSSDQYRMKFYDRFIDNRKKISASLTNRFGFLIENDVLADLRLYATIEKRGFLIIKGEDKIVCRENITLDGTKLMKLS